MKQGGINPGLAELTGKAGEHSVAAQIELRGLNVYFPAVDSGVDLLVENGCRVQVKSAHLRCTPSILKIYPEGVYSFHFPKNRHLAVSSSAVRTTPRRSLCDICDVVVLWGIEQNRFWVVPASLFAGRQCIFMGPSNARDFDRDIPEMLRMQSLGYSTYEIADHFGITQGSAWRRLQRVETQKHGDSTACTVRNCEGAWQHIVDFGAPAATSEQVSSPTDVPMRQEE